MSNLTKVALLKAFGEALEEKPFNKISISDLTSRCGLTRMTFYYHFKDIYELMISGLETQLLNVCKGCVNYDNWKIGYLRIFYFALERKIYIKKIFETIEQEYLKVYLNKMVDRMVISVIEDKCKDIPINEEDKVFTAQVCSHVLLETLLSWVSHGMKEKPELMVKRVGCLLEGMIEKTINGYE